MAISGSILSDGQSSRLLADLGERAILYDRTTSNCKICGGFSRGVDAIDLGRSCHDVRFPLGFAGIQIIYRKCEACNFIFTNDFDEFTPEDWARHIYNDDYIIVDPDYGGKRPLDWCGFVESQFSRRKVVGLDYGAGNGLMASSLRGRGWVYDAYDPFGTSRLSEELHGRYNLCTAFEVFEHLPDPVEGMAAILRMCSPEKLAIVIGTLTSDGEVANGGPLSWWYAGPRNGHISLFSKAALGRLAERFGLAYVSFGSSTHYFTRGWTATEVALMAFGGKARRLVLRR